MTHAFGKVLLALVALFLVADPVMACCVSSMVPTEESAVATLQQETQPPCHGSSAKAPSTTASVAKLPAKAPECPSCDSVDCAAAMSAQELTQPPAALVFAEDPDIAVPSVRVSQVIPGVFSTAIPIPSAPPRADALTLVALKQSLLI